MRGQGERGAPPSLARPRRSARLKRRAVLGCSRSGPFGAGQSERGWKGGAGLSAQTVEATALPGAATLAPGGAGRRQRPPARDPGPGRPRHDGTIPGWCSPCSFIAPLVYSVILSLRSPLDQRLYRVAQLPHRVFSNGEYWSGVVRMGYFGLIQVSVMIGLAILLALFLDSPYCRGRKFFALVYFLPLRRPRGDRGDPVGVPPRTRPRQRPQCPPPPRPRRRVRRHLSITGCPFMRSCSSSLGSSPATT